jgi:multidrug resistance protein MdtO
MVSGFARAARLIAGLTSAHEDKVDSVEFGRIHSIRAAVPGLFSSINAEADAVPFENGYDRRSYLAARDRVRRWLSMLRTVYLLELPLVQTRLDGDSELTSLERREDDERFYQALSDAMSHIANCLENQLEGAKCDHPDHEIASDARVPSDRSRSLATLIQDGNVSPSLNFLATIVDDLERDVSSDPVFAP